MRTHLVVIAVVISERASTAAFQNCQLERSHSEKLFVCLFVYHLSSCLAILGYIFSCLVILHLPPSFLPPRPSCLPSPVLDPVPSFRLPPVDLLVADLLL